MPTPGTDPKAVMEDMHPVLHGTPKIPSPSLKKRTQSNTIMMEQILCGQESAEPGVGSTRGTESLEDPCLFFNTGAIQ